MGVHDGNGIADAAVGCDRIRAAIPTTFTESRTMGDWGDEVMNRHRDCCRLQSWYDPKAKRFKWYRSMSKIVTFDYRGLRIQAEVVDADVCSERVDEWTAFVIEAPMRSPPLEIPLAVWEILNDCEKFMSGLRQRAVEEAR